MSTDDIPLHRFNPTLFEVVFPFYMSDYSHPEAHDPSPHRHDFFEIHYLTAGKEAETHLGLRTLA